MKLSIFRITEGLASISAYLSAYGAAGLFAIALLDSAFVPMAGGPDAVMILLAAANPSRMLFYAFAATFGSLIGCIVLYKLSEKAGGRALKRFSEQKRARVKAWIDRYDVWSVLVASVLPPPFPFKLFVITAGVFKLNLWRFMLAILAGRTFRYVLEGYFAARYGEQAFEIFKRRYPVIGLSAAVLLVVGFIAWSWLQNRIHAREDFTGTR